MAYFSSKHFTMDPEKKQGKHRPSGPVHWQKTAAPKGGGEVLLYS
jgi:hypothetical protein